MTDRIDRDETGRFLPGNSGSPGRPRRQTEAAYLHATLSACSVEMWGKIVDRAVADALGGDAKAREWLATYLIGKSAAVAPSATEALVAELLAQVQDGVLERAAELLVKRQAAALPGFEAEERQHAQQLDQARALLVRDEG